MGQVRVLRVEQIAARWSHVIYPSIEARDIVSMILVRKTLFN